MLILNRFQSFVTRHSLFNDKNKVLLAVSGGKDSVLMAYLFSKTGIEFGIAHCNFKLRGAESDEDEAFVKALAAQLNVAFYTTSFDTQTFASAEGISIQMAARKLRYDWFEKTRSENGYDLIAVAHHRNDSVETILLNLTRGTGIAGLHGIFPKRDKIIRPMLFLDRDEIDKYIEKEKISYREDSSNSSDKYARNKIRLEVIPKLKELNPRLEETFEENSRRFAGIEEYFTRQMNTLRNKLFISQPSGEVEIDLQKLLAADPVPAVLYGLFSPYNFIDNVLEDLRATWNGISGKIFESSTHTLLLDRQRLILRKKEERSSEDVLIYEADIRVCYGDLNLTKTDANATMLHLEKSPNILYLDSSLLIWPLKLRSWQQGDVFYPFGMTGKKKLSDYFISKKIPVTEKQSVPVLENGNGEILWIVGYQSDNRYKVTPQSEKVIIFEVQK